MESRKIQDTSISSHPSIPKINKGEFKKKLVELSEKIKSDKIDLSSEAKKVSEYVQIIKNMPDIRKDKIKEVEKNLVSGVYESKEVLQETLKKIIEEIL